MSAPDSTAVARNVQPLWPRSLPHHITQAQREAEEAATAARQALRAAGTEHQDQLAALQAQVGERT